jgi:hypothetical protein
MDAPFISLKIFPPVIKSWIAADVPLNNAAQGENQ